MPSSMFHVLPHVWQPTSSGFIKSGVSALSNGLGKTPVSNTTKASLGVPSVISTKEIRFLNSEAGGLLLVLRHVLRILMIYVFSSQFQIAKSAPNFLLYDSPS